MPENVGRHVRARLIEDAGQATRSYFESDLICLSRGQLVDDLSDSLGREPAEQPLAGVSGESGYHVGLVRRPQPGQPDYRLCGHRGLKQPSDRRDLFVDGGGLRGGSPIRMLHQARHRMRAAFTTQVGNGWRRFFSPSVRQVMTTPMAAPAAMSSG